MNPIQSICTSLTLVPVNGFVDNELSPSIVEMCGEGIEEVSVWSFFVGYYRVEIETHHELTSEETFRRNVIRTASFYKLGIEKPLILDLMPAHMAFPRLPKQLFIQKDDGSVDVKPNLYTGDQFDKSINAVIALYMGMSRLTGFKAPERDGSCIIERIVLHVPSQSVSVEYGQQISEEVFEDVKSQIEQEFSMRQQEMLDHFLLHFVSGMTHKSKRGLKEVIHEGKAALQNYFERVEWPDEDKAKQVEDLLNELSFDSDEDCPAYISHRVRLRKYIMKLMPKFIEVDFPMESADWGMDCESWGDFFKSDSGERMMQVYQNILFKFLKAGGMSLGVLLASFDMLSSKTIN